MLTVVKLDEHSEYASKKYGIALNDVVIDGWAQYLSKKSDLQPQFIAWVNTKSYEDVLSIFKLKKSSLDSNIVGIRINYPYYFDEFCNEFHISYSTVEHIDDYIQVSFGIYAENWDWKQPWTIVEHLTTFKKQLDISGFDFFTKPQWREILDEGYVSDQDTNLDYEFISDIVLNGYEVTFTCIYDHNDTYELIDKRFTEKLDQVYMASLATLKSKIKNDSLITYFKFSEEISVSCQQYLIYFTKFLKDIGIDAYAEIQEQSSGTVLFSVTPKDETQALSQIREALDIYLNLPRNNSISPMNPTFDLASQQLAANIYHLKSQLLLANAIIQQKDSTIENQSRLIHQQSIANDILVKSLQKHNEDWDTENLVGEIVKVKKAEWEFIELDLPEMLRWLKSKFSKKNIDEVK